jgi:hypothetical protein
MVNEWISYFLTCITEFVSLLNGVTILGVPLLAIIGATILLPWLVSVLIYRG